MNLRSKKVLSLIISIAFIFGIFGSVNVSAFANDSGTCGTNATWSFDSLSGKLTISGTGNMSDYNLISKVPWDSYKSSITSIVVDDGITSIGAYAVYNCIALTSATIGDAVTKIGNYAFYGTRLVYVALGENVSSIGTRSFANCTYLVKATIQNPDLSFGGIAANDPFSGSNALLAFYGHSSSTTQTYAESKGYSFVSIDGCSHLNVYDNVLVEPTCTEKGTKQVICSDCAQVVSTVSIDATGHDYALSSTLTNEEDGHTYNTYTCNVCADEYTESVHNAFVDGYYTSTTLTTPSCTMVGLERHTCDVCGETENIYKPALGHTNTETSRVEPTCETAGSVLSTCDVCGKTTTQVLPATGHTLSEYVVTTEPTCVTAGEETATCSVCGKSVTRSIQALGHDYVVTSTTKSEDGHTYEVSVCANCGDTKTDITHNDFVTGYYSVKIVNEPTCAINGVEIDTCNICKKTRTVTHDKIGHDYEETSRIEPTCTAKGYIYYTCKNCGNERHDTVDALGHDYYEYSTVPSTCKEAGLATMKCRRCSYSTSSVLPLAQHNYVITSHSKNDNLITYTCSVCNDATQEINYENLFDMIVNYIGSSKNDENYSSIADLNSDGCVNARDLLSFSKIDK